MKKVILILSLIVLFTGIALSEYLVLYPDGFALKGDSVLKNSNIVELEVIESMLLDSFQSFPQPSKIDYNPSQEFNLENELTKLVGKEIKWMQEDGTIVNYELISANPVLLKSDFGIFAPKEGIPVFDSISIDNDSILKITYLDKSAKLDYSYLFTGLSGKIGYNIFIDGKSNATVYGNLIVTNNTTKNIFTDNFILFSGDINKVESYGGYSNARSAMLYEADSFAKSVSSDSLEDYRLYSLKGSYDFKPDKTDIFGFYSAEVEYEKVFTYSGYYGGGNGEYTSLTQTILIDKLPREIPAGNVRIYTDFNNSKVLLGEDTVSNKSSGDSLELQMGKSSDILGKYEMLSSTQVGKTVYQSYKFTVKNLTENNKTVRFRTSIPRDAKLTVHGVEYQRPQAGELIIPIKANGNGETEVNFEIQYSR